MDRKGSCRGVLVGLLIVAGAGAGGAARAADLRGQGSLSFGAGYDSNAARAFVIPGQPTSGDGLVSGILNLEGAARGERWSVRGLYDAGGRKFVTIPSEDTLVQNAQLDGRLVPIERLELGALVRVRDRRGADRTYTHLVADAVASVAPSAAWTIGLRGGGERFWYRSRPEAGFVAPVVTLTAQVRFLKRHALYAAASYAPRSYDGLANLRPTTTTPPDPDTLPPRPRRRDGVVAASLTYAWRGPIFVSASYQYLDQWSNSFGEALRRHRLSLMAAVRLPWQVTLLGSGAVHLSSYPDGLFLSSDIQVAEDDENGSTFAVKLVRPLWRRVDVELRYAFYANSMPRNEFVYERHVGTAGFALVF